MEYQRNPVKNPVLIVCIILIAGNFILGNYMMEQRYLAYQQSLIGNIYLREPEACRAYLDILFREEPDEESLQAGQEAMVQYGYTAKGLYYLVQKNGVPQLYLRMGGVYLLLLGTALIVLSASHKKNKRRTELLLDRLKALDKLKGQERYLQEANGRIQAFIENIAHQIRTPVSRVMTSLELIQEKPENEKQKERLQECISHLDSIRLLIVRLLDIARMEAGRVPFRKEYMQLEELLLESSRACCGATERIDIRLIADEKDTGYYGDYEWLKEAFVNIFKNCVEHDDSGVPIEVLCKKEPEYYVIRIRDHGAGFMEADIPNLFDRFYLPGHIKSSHVGIGLNLAKLIIEAHFGTIHAVNHEEGGAVFDIMLPVYALKIGKI